MCLVGFVRTGYLIVHVQLLQLLHSQSSNDYECENTDNTICIHTIAPSTIFYL